MLTKDSHYCKLKTTFRYVTFGIDRQDRFNFSVPRSNWHIMYNYDKNVNGSVP
jgi:hypothetical protein